MNDGLLADLNEEWGLDPFSSASLDRLLTLSGLESLFSRDGSDIDMLRAFADTLTATTERALLQNTAAQPLDGATAHSVYFACAVSQASTHINSSGSGAGFGQTNTITSAFPLNHHQQLGLNHHQQLQLQTPMEEGPQARLISRAVPSSFPAFSPFTLCALPAQQQYKAPLLPPQPLAQMSLPSHAAHNPFAIRSSAMHAHITSGATTAAMPPARPQRTSLPGQQQQEEWLPQPSSSGGRSSSASGAEPSSSGNTFGGAQQDRAAAAGRPAGGARMDGPGRAPAPRGRPRKTPLVDPEGHIKRTRGEVEKDRITALQEVVDGKAVELLQLSVENCALQGHATLLAELVEFREMQMEFIQRRLLPAAALAALPPVSASYPWLVPGGGSILEMAAQTRFQDPGFCPVPGTTVSLEQYKTLDKTQLMVMYQKAAEHIGELLLDVDAPAAHHGVAPSGGGMAAAAAALARLQDFMQEFRFTMGIAVLCNPAAFQCRGMCCDPTRPLPPPDDYWLRVLAAMALTPEQRRRAADVYGLCRGRLAGLELERSLIAVQLTQLMGVGESFNAVSDLKQEELGAALYDNVMQEKGVIMLISGFIRTCILTTIQRARCVTTAYPYVPDLLSIASILYDELYLGTT